MITNELEFPCLEASRCFLTEKEHGMRLSLSTKKEPLNPKLALANAFSKNDKQPSFHLNFSKHRAKSEEWYVHLDHTTTTSPGTTKTCNGCQTQRILQLVHCVTGQYLAANTTSIDNQDSSKEVVVIGTQSVSSDNTKWIMDPVQSNSSSDHHVYFTLTSVAYAPRQLKCVNDSHRPLHGSDGSSRLALTTAEATTPNNNHKYSAGWEMEWTSGELCFLSNPVVHSQVRCNLLGQLSLNRKFEGWEVWRFIETGKDGHVVISSWTHSHKFLSSDSDGQVFTTENRLGAWEQWNLSKAPNGVYIKSVAHQGRYLSIGRHDDEVLHTTTKPGDYAKWHLDAAHSHVYYLGMTRTTTKITNSQNKQYYVSSNRRGAFVTQHKRTWEEWKMERCANGYVTFFNVTHETYLGSNSQGVVHTTSSKGDWSRWELEESHTPGSLYVRSKSHQRLLSYDGKTLSTTEDQYTENETWRLEPRLPAYINGAKIAAMGAAGALGVAVTVAMPFAVLGAVEAAGLTAEVLAVGFTAEAMAGLGGGALLGATVLGSTAQYVADQDSKHQKDGMAPATAEFKEDYMTSSFRPISAWRTW